MALSYNWRFQEFVILVFTEVLIIQASFLGTHKGQPNPQELRLAAETGISQDDVMNAQPSKRSPAITVTRSRSSIRENSTDAARLTMKDLIHKFECRSVTSAQIKPSKFKMKDWVRLAHRDLKSSSTKNAVKISYKTPVSISCEQMKSKKPFVSRSVYAKTPRTAINLKSQTITTLNKHLKSQTTSTTNQHLKSQTTHPTNEHLEPQTTTTTNEHLESQMTYFTNEHVESQMTLTMNETFQDCNSEAHDSSFRNIEEEIYDMCGSEGKLNVTNSHLTKNFEWIDAPVSQEDEKCSIDLKASPSISIDKVASTHEDLLHKVNDSTRTYEERKQKPATPDQPVPPPLRVSLRGIAAQKKLISDKKYVVHVKDWTKQFKIAKKQSDKAQSIIPIWKRNAIGLRYTGEKDILLKNMKVDQPNYSQEKREEKARRTRIADHVGNYNRSILPIITQRTLESIRQLGQSPSSEEKRPAVVKQKNTAVERYYQFLRSSKPPQPQRQSPSLNNDLWKISRQPMTYNFLKANRGIGAMLPKSNILNTVEPDSPNLRQKSPNSQQNDIQPKQQPEIVLPCEVVTPASKLSLGPSVEAIPPDLSKVNMVENPLRLSPESVTPNIPADSKKLVPQNQKKGQAILGQCMSIGSRPSLSCRPRTPTRYQEPAKDHEVLSKSDVKLTLPKKFGNKIARQIRKPFHSMIPTRPNLHRTMDAVRFKRNLCQTSPGDSSSVSSYRVGCIKHAYLNQYVSPEKKVAINNTDETGRWSRILTEEELANNELIPEHHKDRQMKTFPSRISHLFSSSEESRIGCRESPFRKGHAPLKKMNNKSAADSASEISAQIDTLQTQYIATRKNTAGERPTSTERSRDQSKDSAKVLDGYLLSEKVDKNREINFEMSPPDVFVSKTNTKLKTPSPVKKPRKRLSLFSGISVTQTQIISSVDSTRGSHYSSTDTEKTMSWKLAEGPEDFLLQESGSNSADELEKLTTDEQTYPIRGHGDAKLERNFLLKNARRCMPVISPQRKKRKVERSKKKTGMGKPTVKKEMGETKKNRGDFLRKQYVLEKIDGSAEKFDMTYQPDLRSCRVGKGKKVGRLVKKHRSEGGKRMKLKAPVEIDILEATEETDISVKQSSRDSSCQQKSDVTDPSPIGVPIEFSRVECFSCSGDGDGSISLKKQKLSITTIKPQPSTRQCLDSAVLEEWTLHCWLPTIDGQEDPSEVQSRKSQQDLGEGVLAAPWHGEVHEGWREDGGRKQSEGTTGQTHVFGRCVYVNDNHVVESHNIKMKTRCKRCSIASYQRGIRYRQDLIPHGNVVNVDFYCCNQRLKVDFLKYKINSPGDSVSRPARTCNPQVLYGYPARGVCVYRQQMCIVAVRRWSGFRTRPPETCVCRVVVVTARIVVVLALRTGHGRSEIALKEATSNRISYCNFSVHKIETEITQILLSTDSSGKTQTQIIYFSSNRETKVTLMRPCFNSPKYLHLDANNNSSSRPYDKSHKEETFTRNSCDNFVMPEHSARNSCDNFEMPEHSARNSCDNFVMPEHSARNSCDNFVMPEHSARNSCNFEMPEHSARNSCDNFVMPEHSARNSCNFEMPEHSARNSCDNFVMPEHSARNSCDNFVMPEHSARNSCDNFEMPNHSGCPQKRMSSMKASALSRRGRDDYLHLNYRLTKNLCRRRSHQRQMYLRNRSKQWCMIGSVLDITMTYLYLDEARKMCQETEDTGRVCLCEIKYSNELATSLDKDVVSSAASGGQPVPAPSTNLSAIQAPGNKHCSYDKAINCLHTRSYSDSHKLSLNDKSSILQAQHLLTSTDSASCLTSLLESYDLPTQKQLMYNMKYSTKGRNNNSKGNNSPCPDDQKPLPQRKQQQFQGRAGLPPSMIKSKCSRFESVPERHSQVSQNWTSELKKARMCRHLENKAAKLGANESKKQSPVGSHISYQVTWAQEVQNSDHRTPRRKEADLSIARKCPTKSSRYRVHKINQCDSYWTKRKYTQSPQISPGADHTYVLRGAPCSPMKGFATALAESSRTHVSPVLVSHHFKPSLELSSNSYRRDSRLAQLAKRASNTSNALRNKVKSENMVRNENSSNEDELHQCDQYKCPDADCEDRKLNEELASSRMKHLQNQAATPTRDKVEESYQQPKLHPRFVCYDSRPGTHDKLANSLLRQSANVHVRGISNYKFDDSRTGAHDKLANSLLRQSANAHVRGISNYKFDDSRTGLHNSGLRQADNVDVKGRNNYKFDFGKVGHRDKQSSSPLRRTDNSDVRSSFNYKLDDGRASHRDKQTSSPLRHTDNPEVRSGHSFKFDDTETCKTTSTWNEDPTLSRSFKRDARRSQGKYSGRNILTDSNVSTEVKKKVEMLVKSYRDFLEKEEAKRQNEAHFLTSHEVKSAHEVTMNIPESKTSEQVSITKMDEEFLPELPTATEGKSASCNIDISSSWRNSTDTHTNKPCKHSLPTKLMNVSTVKKSADIDMSEGKFNTTTCTSESQTTFEHISQQHFSEFPPNSTAARASIVKEKLQDSLNWNKASKNVLEKTNKHSNDQVVVPKHSVIQTFPSKKHLEQDYYQEEENEIVFGKQETDINGPTCDLILTYNMENAAQSFLTMQSDLCQQMSAADERSQCFTFLINDTLKNNNEMVKCNNSTFKFNGDPVLCLGADNKILLEAKQPNKQESYPPKPSRIPVYVNNEKVCNEAHSSQNEALKYGQGDQVLLNEQDSMYNIIKEIESWNTDADTQPVVRKRLRRKTPTTPSRIPVIISRHKVKKISLRSKIPVAVKCQYRKYVSLCASGGDRNVEFLSTSTICPRYTFKGENQNPLKTLMRPPEIGKNLQFQETDLQNLQFQETDLQNLQFQQTDLPTDACRELLNSNEIVKKGNKKMENVSWLPNCAYQRKTDLPAKSKPPMKYFPEELGDNVPTKLAWVNYAASVERCKKACAATTANHESRPLMGKASFRVAKNMDYKYASQDEPEGGRKYQSPAAARQTFPSENKKTLQRFSGSKPVQPNFKKHPRVISATNTFHPTKEKGGTATDEAVPIKTEHPLKLDQQKNVPFPQEVVALISHKQRVHLPEEINYKQPTGISLHKHVMERSDPVLSSKSVTFQSVISSSEESKLSFTVSSESSKEYRGRQETPLKGFVPLKDFYHTQLASVHSQPKSKSLISAINSSTSSWRTASSEIEKQSAILSFPPDIRLEDNSELADDSQSGSSSSINERESSKVYSISSYNIDDESNSDKSSFSTMRNISDLPYTFPSNSQDRTSNFLTSDPHYRGNSHLTKAYRKNLHRHMNQRKSFTAGNHNTSNRKCWMSSSEPYLTTKSSNKFVRASRSVTNFSAMTQGYREHCSLVEQFNDKYGRPFLSFETVTKVVEKSTKQIHQSKRGNCNTKTNAIQPANSNFQPLSVCAITSQEKSPSVSGTKRKLNQSHNKSPQKPGLAHDSRIKYCPEASQPQAGKPMVYFCNKTSPVCSKKKEMEAFSRTMADPHITHDNVRTPHKDKLEVNNVMSCKAESAQGTKALSTFANILKFWQGMGPVKNWCQAGLKSAQKAEDPVGLQKLENRSSEENSTVFHSAVGGGKTHIDRECNGTPRSIGVDSTQMANFKEVQLSRQDHEEDLDEQSNSRMKSLDDNSMRQSVASKDTCYSGLDDNVYQRHCADKLYFSPNFSVTSNMIPVPETVRSPTSLQTMTWANRNADFYSKSLQQRTTTSCARTPLLLDHTPAVNMCPFGLTTNQLEKVGNKESSMDSVWETSYHIRTPVKLFVCRKVQAEEYSRSSGLHSALESTPLQRTTRKSHSLQRFSPDKLNHTFSKQIDKALVADSPGCEGEHVHPSSVDRVTPYDECFPISAGLDYTSGSSPESTSLTPKHKHGHKKLPHKRPQKQTTRNDDQANVTSKVDKHSRKSYIKSCTLDRVSRDNKIFNTTLSTSLDSIIFKNRDHIFPMVTNSLSGHDSAGESGQHLSKLTPSRPSRRMIGLKAVHLLLSSTSSSSTSTEKTTDKSGQTTTEQVHSSELDKLSEPFQYRTSSSHYRTVISANPRTRHLTNPLGSEESMHTCHCAGWIMTSWSSPNTSQSLEYMQQSVYADSKTTMNSSEKHVARLAGLLDGIQVNTNRIIPNAHDGQKLARESNAQQRSRFSRKPLATPHMHKADFCSNRRVKHPECGTVVLKKMHRLSQLPSGDSRSPNGKNWERLTDVQQSCRKHTQIGAMQQRENTNRYVKKIRMKNETNSGEGKHGNHCVINDDASSDSTNHETNSPEVSSSSAQRVTEEWRNRGSNVNSPCANVGWTKPSPARTVIISANKHFTLPTFDERADFYGKQGKKFSRKEQACRAHLDSESASTSSGNEFQSVISMNASQKQHNGDSFQPKRLKESVKHQHILPQTHLLGVSPSDKHFDDEDSQPCRHSNAQLLPEQGDERLTSESSSTSSHELQAIVVSPLTRHQLSASESSSSQEYLLVRRHTRHPKQVTISPKRDQKVLQLLNLSSKDQHFVNFGEQLSHIDSHLKSVLPELFNTSSSTRKQIRPTFMSACSQGQPGPLSPPILPAQATFLEKSIQAVQACHVKSQPENVKSVKYSLLRGSPGQKPGKCQQNTKPSFLLSDLGLPVSMTRQDICQVSATTERQNIPGVNVLKTLNSNFNEMEHGYEGCSNYYQQLHSLRQPGQDSYKHGIQSAPSYRRPLKSTAVTKMLVASKKQLENATLRSFKGSRLENEHLQWAKRNHASKSLKFNCDSSVVEGSQMYISKTLPQVVNFPIYQTLNGQTRLRKNLSVDAQKQVHCLISDSQAKLRRFRSAPSWSTTDRFQNVGNAISVPCVGSIKSADIGPECSTILDQNPTVIMNKVLWNTHRIGHEPKLSQAVDGSNTTETSSCSQRFRDVEIVLGRDIPLVDVMNYLLKSLQVNNSQLSKDEPCSHNSLSSQVRLVIDKILADDHGIDHNKHQVISESKASPRELDDGNEKLEQFSSERAANNSDKQLQLSTELTGQEQPKGNSGIIAHGGASKIDLLEKSSIVVKQEEAHTGSRDIPNGAYTTKNQRHSNAQVKDNQLRSPGERRTTNDIQNTSINEDGKQLQPNSSKQTCDGNENRYHRTPGSIIELIERVKATLQRTENRSQSMRHHFLPALSSSGSILSRNSAKWLRRVRPHVTTKQRNQDRNNITTGTAKKQTIGKLPCPSSPGLNLTARKQMHKDSDNRRRNIRQLPEEQITFSKPNNCHLNKVIKTNNQMTLTFLAHNKLRNLTRNKAEPEQDNVRGPQPVKGLNATLLEKESQILLTRDALAGQKNGSHIFHGDMARTRLGVGKVEHRGKRGRQLGGQPNLLGRGDTGSSKPHHQEAYFGPKTITAQSPPTPKAKRTARNDPIEVPKDLLFRLSGTNPMIGRDQDQSDFTRTIGLQTAFTGTSGLQTAFTGTSGHKTAFTETSGLQTAFTGTSGHKTAFTETSGLQTAFTGTSGHKTAFTETSGLQTAFTGTSGLQTAFNESTSWSSGRNLVPCIITKKGKKSKLEMAKTNSTIPENRKKICGDVGRNTFTEFPHRSHKRPEFNSTRTNKSEKLEMQQIMSLFAKFLSDKQHTGHAQENSESGKTRDMCDRHVFTQDNTGASLHPDSQNTSEPFSHQNEPFIKSGKLGVEPKRPCLAAVKRSLKIHNEQRPSAKFGTKPTMKPGSLRDTLGDRKTQGSGRCRDEFNPNLYAQAQDGDRAGCRSPFRSRTLETSIMSQPVRSKRNMNSDLLSKTVNTKFPHDRSRRVEMVTDTARMKAREDYVSPYKFTAPADTRKVKTTATNSPKVTFSKDTGRNLSSPEMSDTFHSRLIRAVRTLKGETRSTRLPRLEDVYSQPKSTTCSADPTHGRTIATSTGGTASTCVPRPEGVYSQPKSTTCSTQGRPGDTSTGRTRSTYVPRLADAYSQPRSRTDPTRGRTVATSTGGRTGSMCMPQPEDVYSQPKSTTDPTRGRTVDTSTGKTRSTCMPRIEDAYSQPKSRTDPTQGYTVATSTGRTGSTYVPQLEGAYSQPKSTACSTQVHNAATSTDFPVVRFIDKVDEDILTTEPASTTAAVRTVGTCTNLSFTNFRQEVLESWPYTADSLFDLKLNSSMRDSQEHQAIQEQETHLDKNVTCKKPPPSSFNDRRKLGDTSSRGEVVNGLLKGDKTLTSHLEELSFLESSSSKLGLQEMGLPQMSFSEKSYEPSKRSSLPTTLKSSCNEIKVKAPCSVCTLQDNINLTLVQESGRKCVKLSVPPNDQYAPYEIVVEPDSWNDGPATVVADMGMIHVRFDKKKPVDRRSKYNTAHWSKLAVPSSASVSSHDSFIWTESSSSSTDSYKNSEFRNHLRVHSRRNKPRSAGVENDTNPSDRTATKTIDKCGRRHVPLRKHSGDESSRDAASTAGEFATFHKSTQYEVVNAVSQFTEHGEAALHKTTMDIETQQHKSSPTKLSSSAVNDKQRLREAAHVDKKVPAVSVLNNVADKEGKEPRGERKQVTEVGQTRPDNQQTGIVRTKSRDVPESSRGSSDQACTVNRVEVAKKAVPVPQTKVRTKQVINTSNKTSSDESSSESDDPVPDKKAAGSSVPRAPADDTEDNVSPLELDVSSESSFNNSKTRPAKSRNCQNSANRLKEMPRSLSNSDECEQSTWDENDARSERDRILLRKSTIACKNPQAGVRSSTKNVNKKLRQKSAGRKAIRNDTLTEEPSGAMRKSDSDSSRLIKRSDKRLIQKWQQGETDDESDRDPYLQRSVKRHIESRPGNQLRGTPRHAKVSSSQDVEISESFLRQNQGTPNHGYERALARHRHHGRANQTQVRFSDKVTSYSEGEQNPSIEDAGQDDVATPVYSDQQPHYVHGNVPTPPNPTSYHSYPNAAFGMTGEGLRHPPAYTNHGNERFIINYFPSGAQLTPNGNNTPGFHTPPMWHSRSPNHKLPAYQASPFAIPWPRDADVFQRIPRRRIVNERTDSGYSELSTPTDYTGYDMNEWDRAVKMKLQERSRNVLSRNM